MQLLIIVIQFDIKITRIKLQTTLNKYLIGFILLKNISCHCEGYIKHYHTWEPCFTFPDIVIRYAIFIICIIMIECWWMIWWRFMFCHITTKYFYSTKVNFMCLGMFLFSFLISIVIGRCLRKRSSLCISLIKIFQNHSFKF